MPDKHPLQPGDPAELGQYRLLGRLGKGAQGVVYKAQGPDGELVAIKLLNTRLDRPGIDAERFMREVAAARRVAQFCTAQVIGANMDGDLPYIVSELVEGVSLQRVVQTDGPRSGGALYRLAVGTVTALAAIHRAGIVHRDFKPSNVLLGPDGPRVIDFGIARALDSSMTLSSGVVGTPAYMSPEQISGERVGPASDMFSWALTMTFAATGAPAFGQDSLPAVIYRVINDEPDLSAFPDSLRPLVQVCLSKRAEERPSAAEALFSLLENQGAVAELDAEVAMSTGSQVASVDERPPGVLDSLPDGWANPDDAGRNHRAKPSSPNPAPSHPGQPNSGPNPGQPNPGQPNPGQPGAGRSHPGQPNPGHSNPGHSNPGQPNPNHSNPGGWASPSESHPSGWVSPSGLPANAYIPPQTPAQPYRPPQVHVPPQQPSSPVPPPPQAVPSQAVPSQAKPQQAAGGDANPGQPYAGQYPLGAYPPPRASRDNDNDNDAFFRETRPEEKRAEDRARRRRAGMVGGALALALALAAGVLVFAPRAFEGRQDPTRTTLAGDTTSTSPSATPSPPASATPSGSPSPSVSLVPTGTPTAPPQVSVPPVLGEQDGKSLAGHSEAVQSMSAIKISGSQRFVSGGQDGVVRIWDPAKRSTVAKLRGHDNDVYAVACVTVGSTPMAVTGGYDHTVRLWNLKTRKGTVLGRHPIAVFAVAVGKAGGKYVAVTGDGDGMLRFWDLKKRRQLGSVKAHGKDINWLSVGRVGDRPVVVSASEDETLRVWDLAKRKAYGKTYKGHSKAVFSVAVGQVDGKAVVASGGKDEKIRLWDPKTGRSVGKAMSGHTSNVYSLSFGSVDGKAVLASGSTDGTIRLWDPQTTKALGGKVKAHTGGVYSVAVATVGKAPAVVSAGKDKRIRIWRFGTPGP
ncbi:protein kinase domain-containing protein [Nonomuraea africana]|uniref:protein kinase domain-containing protein n=1 Tax=Nonomuraea africana TaxID=46171 RepID=UPI0033D10E14